MALRRLNLLIGPSNNFKNPDPIKYGSGKFYNDPQKGQPHQAVYCIINNRMINVATDLDGDWIVFSEDKYLGKIMAPERPANMAWGDGGKIASVSQS